MPLYEFKCGECGHVTGVTAPMKAAPIGENCESCGSMNTSRIFEFREGNRDYATPIVSQSLAMHPEQIGEHRRLFPEIKVTDDGCPVFSNYADHDAYLKKTGFQKNPGKRLPRSRNGVTVIKMSDIIQERENAKT